MVKRILSKLLGKGEPAPENGAGEEQVEALRNAFKARYHHFKLLLNANNEALLVMTEIEEALQGLQPFGMHFIRAAVTRCSSSVYNIIRHLDALAPGRYEELFDKFKDISGQINEIMALRIEESGAPLVLDLSEIGLGQSSQVGSKMASLGEASARIGLPVPEGFVATAAAQRYFLGHKGLQEEIDRLIQTADARRFDRFQALSSQVQRLIISSELPADLEEAIAAAYSDLEQKTAGPFGLAVRSSAIGEDVQGASFAGQYRSVLNVGKDSLIEAYKEVVASKYTPQAMTYRLLRGIPDHLAAMSVGFLRMVEAASGGVAYSRSPLDPDSKAVHIHSVWGLPQVVVEGGEPVDVFVVDREPGLSIARRSVAHKKLRSVCRLHEGCGREPLPGDLEDRPSLTDEQVLELARMCIRLEEHFGAPQDVEWSIAAAGDLVLLQSRPISFPTADSEKPGKAAGHERVEETVLFKGGQTASIGAACGPVHLIRKDADTLGFPDNGIMVLDQPHPRRAALMSRAAAVVAQRGSVAGHLANVAREFGVPALFGAEEALEALENGQLVTVDADAGVVYAGRAQQVIARAAARPNLLAGSPVHEKLQEVSRLIVPLNLLDPNDTSFRPRSCKTFHDITRFCHEKSVDEMFHFGEEQSFPARSSKQLVTSVPMQFWIIDLEDGFREEVKGKRVHLDDIVSIPMLALWRGMVAVPWSGPPPVDAKGFMSVLFEATANPDLNTTSRSKFAVKNYFMISSNFCSLQSRFGFHFCQVESLVGDRPVENYATFQFKGGAAGLDRRVRRTRFIADLLEEYGFRTRVREDALTARVENYDMQEMEERLELLGYLIIHTRQLDMIMCDQGCVAEQREKMQKDLDKLRAQRKRGLKHMKKILLALDGSSLAEKACEAARDMAELTGAEVVCVHIRQKSPVPGTTEGVLVESPDASGPDASAILAPCTDMLDRSEVAYRSVVKDGSPGREIVAAARQENCDLIIMGSRGRSDLAGLLLGSVAHKVLQTAPCPVLVIR